MKIVAINISCETTKWNFNKKLYSTRAKDAIEKAAFFRRHYNIIKYIERGGKPTVDSISKALNYSKGVIIEQHLALCKQIIKNPITCILPRTNTEHVVPFEKEKIAGQKKL